MPTLEQGTAPEEDHGSEGDPHWGGSSLGKLLPVGDLPPPSWWSSWRTVSRGRNAGVATGEDSKKCFL